MKIVKQQIFQLSIPIKKTFKNAKDTQGKMNEGGLPNTAQRVVSAVEKQIKSDEITILSVIDNGIGLDENRMGGLIGEARTIKTGGSTGSFGYGHTTVVPTSDLRYILYGGFNSSGAIASGHAVLASSQDKDGHKSNNGYYIIDVAKKDVKNFYVFPKNKQVPKLVQRKLDTAKKEWGEDSGTAVIISGFNYFREEPEELWNSIKRAVVSNFFVAIKQGKLRVEFVDHKSGGKLQAIDDENLQSELEKIKDEKTSKGFLAGQKANVAYQTMCEGKEHVVDTGLGKIKIKVRELNDGGRSQIDLCRNGMHITSSIPSIRTTHFTDYQPFHCLILVDAQNDKIHDLVRRSEPPKHNEIVYEKSRRC